MFFRTLLNEIIMMFNPEVKESFGYNDEYDRFPEDDEPFDIFEQLDNSSQ